LQPVKFLLAKSNTGPLPHLGFFKKIRNKTNWSSCFRLSFFFVLACFLLTKMLFHYGNIGAHLLTDIFVISHITNFKEVLELEGIVML